MWVRVWSMRRQAGSLRFLIRAARAVGQRQQRPWRAKAKVWYRPAQTRLHVQIQIRREPGEANEIVRKSQTPTRMKRHDAAGHRGIRDTPEAGRLDHCLEGFRLWKFPDRFDQILISLAVTGHRRSDARNHVKGIKLI